MKLIPAQNRAKGPFLRCALLSVILIFSLSACMSTRDITYFQPVTPSADKAVYKIEQTYVPRIKKGDILSIGVSSLNEQANAMFNPLSQTVTNPTQSAGNPTQPVVSGFPVDESGLVVLPLVGQVQAGGYTAREFSVRLTEQLKNYLEEPTVTVRIANYQVSILGEVSRPGIYTISNETVTLPEVLAMAGDATVFGKRKDMLIIRESEGLREFARVDMTSRELFESPYYYLHSGDIVYIGPTPGKLTSSDRTLQLTPLVFSTLTLVVLLFNTFK